MKGSIEVSAMLNHREQLNIRVKDSGIGIPPSDQPRIFKLFGKLDGNESANPQGCGLGLSISNHIVEKLSGERILLKSVSGKGSVFSFNVDIGSHGEIVSETLGDPYAELSDDDSPRALVPLNSFDSESIKFRAAQILIVDDSDFNRIVARKMVEALGYICDEAITGLQALNQVREKVHIGTPYQLILMDVEMPEMDGNTATREIRNMSEIQKQPIIVGCSAYSSQEDKEISLSAGMDQYLEKPISRDQLYELLRAFLHDPLT